MKISDDFIKLINNKLDLRKYNLDLYDLYFSDETKLCKKFRDLIEEIINIYLDQFTENQKGGNVKYKKEKNLLKCNNLFNKCEDDENCYNFTELNEKNKDIDCIEGTNCGPLDPITRMPLTKDNNVWIHTLTKNCYERINLNEWLKQHRTDPITRDIISDENIYLIYKDYFTNLNLQNRLIYRFNKITQYMRENPIKSFITGATIAYSLPLLHDLIRYGKLEVAGHGLHNGNIIDNIQGLTALSTVIFTSYYTNPAFSSRRNNLQNIYIRNQDNEIKKMNELIKDNIIPF